MVHAHENKSSQSCPTPTAHKRLEEAHRFWHECLDEYQSPEGFRVKLNACIQALRNVTFVLQKEKALIEGFADWYKPWQEKMRADPILRWIVDSRNRIVKEGDLETHSEAIGRLIYDYSAAADSITESLPNFSASRIAKEDDREIQAPPRYSAEQIVKMIMDSGIPRSVALESSVTIERRWIDRALPNHELLDALATAYARLNDVIADAHTRIGMDSVVGVHTESGDIQIARHPGWHGRLPCMVTTRDMRTISILLKDGTVNDHGRSWRIPFDSEGAAKAAKRYGMLEREEGETWHSALDAVPLYIKAAQRVLRTGEEHGWFIFYFRGGEAHDAQVLAALDRAGKRKLAQEIADHVARNGFDSVIMVGEVWYAPITLDEEQVLVNASDHPDRSECLGVFAEDSEGRYRTVLIPFRRMRRIKKTIILEDPRDITDHAPAHNFFAPLRSVWQTWPKTESKG